MLIFRFKCTHTCALSRTNTFIHIDTHRHMILPHIHIHTHTHTHAGIRASENCYYAGNRLSFLWCAYNCQESHWYLAGVFWYAPLRLRPGLSLSLSLSLSLFLSLSLSLSLTRVHTHTLSLSLSHTLTHTLSLSLLLPLSLSLARVHPTPTSTLPSSPPHTQVQSSQLQQDVAETLRSLGIELTEESMDPATGFCVGSWVDVAVCCSVEF